MLTKKGYTSGLVATSSITHATPAAFYAHIDSRYKEVEIANQLLDSSIDISLGGGLEFFDLEQAKVSHKLITDKTYFIDILSLNLNLGDILHLNSLAE